MANIFIEKYRGIDISFSTDREVFYCVVYDENTKESKSWAAIKKQIDDYLKDNQNFKPFFVEPMPMSYGFSEGKMYEIIGIRKDGRYISKDSEGNQSQLLSHEEGYLMVFDDRNSEHIAEIRKLMDDLSEYRKAMNQKINDITGKMVIKPLSSVPR